MTKTPDGIEVIEGPQLGRRRRYTAEEKRRLVTEACEPGSSLSLVARRNLISSSLLFRCRRMELGELESLGADEQVVALSEAQQLQARVRELGRLLGKKDDGSGDSEESSGADPLKNNCCCARTGADLEIPSEGCGRGAGLVGR
jgi:transposase